MKGTFSNGLKYIIDSLGYEWRIRRYPGNRYRLRMVGDTSPGGGYWCESYAEAEKILIDGLYIEPPEKENTMKNKKPKAGDLRVWHIPQLPGKPFRVAVSSPDEAVKLLGVLAEYDNFQFVNHIKPDYSNANGLEIFEDGEWGEWHHETTGEDVSEYGDALQEPQ